MRMISNETDDTSPPSYKETMMEYSKMSNEGAYYEIIDATAQQFDETFSQSNQTEADYELETIIQQDTLFQKNIEQNYPVKYLIVDCVLMVLFNSSLIGLQVFAMENDAALAYLGSAIWAALYNLGAVFLAILTSTKIYFNL